MIGFLSYTPLLLPTPDIPIHTFTENVHYATYKSYPPDFVYKPVIMFNCNIPVNPTDIADTKCAILFYLETQDYILKIGMVILKTDSEEYKLKQLSVIHPTDTRHDTDTINISETSHMNLINAIKKIIFQLKKFTQCRYSPNM